MGWGWGIVLHALHGHGDSGNRVYSNDHVNVSSSFKFAKLEFGPFVRMVVTFPGKVLGQGASVLFHKTKTKCNWPIREPSPLSLLGMTVPHRCTCAIILDWNKRSNSQL